MMKSRLLGVLLKKYKSTEFENESPLDFNEGHLEIPAGSPLMLILYVIDSAASRIFRLVAEALSLQIQIVFNFFPCFSCEIAAILKLVNSSQRYETYSSLKKKKDYIPYIIKKTVHCIFGLQSTKEIVIAITN